jgi:leader peptidase (prepilin peptidase)/N-methyltransferase
VTWVDPNVASEAPGPKAGRRLEHADLRRTKSRGWAIRPAWCVLSAVVLLASLAIAPDAEGALGGALGLLMLGVAFVDGRRFIVPDALSGGAFLLGVIRAAVADPGLGFEGPLMAVSRAALAAGLLLLIRVVYRRLRGREGLGLGDVKLAGAAGAWLSLPILPIAMEFAAITALAAYVIRQTKRIRVLRGAARVPFGAFFAPAVWLGWALEAMLPNLN